MKPRIGQSIVVNYIVWVFQIAKTSLQHAIFVMLQQHTYKKATLIIYWNYSRNLKTKKKTVGHRNDRSD